MISAMALQARIVQSALTSFFFVVITRQGHLVRNKMAVRKLRAVLKSF